MNVKIREKQLLACVPTVLDYNSLLYIGAKKGRMQMVRLFIAANYTIDILEIWPSNIKALEGSKNIRKVIEGDARNVLGMKLTPYDIIMWWHGPEHIQEQELRGVLDNLKKISKKLIITACPWGIYKQGEVEGNVYEFHLSHLYTEFFEELGWKTNTIGKKDMPGSNLLAWQKQ